MHAMQHNIRHNYPCIMCCLPIESMSFISKIFQEACATIKMVMGDIVVNNFCIETPSEI